MSADIATSSGDPPPPHPNEDPNCCYRVVRTLGEGAFGEVLLVVNKVNPRLAVAMKKMRITSTTNSNIFKKEFLIQNKLSKVGHDNIIRTIGMRDENGFHLLFLEYADGGELFDKIEPDRGMPVENAQFYFRQLIQGLKYIHDNDIVHRDIKPENLLLTSSHVLKISDFGMATLYQHQGKQRMLDMSCGTIPYAAPEVCKGGLYWGPPIDIWSSGIVLIAMLSGELPWDRASDSSYAYLEWLGNNNLEQNPWRKMDVRALCFLRRVVTDNVAKRATIEQIQADPWYTFDHGRLETVYGRPLKRARFTDENSPIDCNITSTQQADAVSTAKRRHLETPDKVFSGERQNASFSQPTRTDDLLLSQHIDMSQNNTNILERLVCRMTRFCTKSDLPTSHRQLVYACEGAGYEVRQTFDTSLLVTYREISMMITLYVLPDGTDGQQKVMIDFRRSRGDGIQFKKMFVEVKNRMHDAIMKGGQEFLENHGYLQRLPQFVRQAEGGTSTVSHNHI